MLRIFVPLVAIAFLSSIGTALADEVTGRVKVIDVQGAEIVLEDGTFFVLNPGAVAAEGIGPGDMVRVEYADVEGDLVATVVTKVDG